jgi:hypothetical protein
MLGKASKTNLRLLAFDSRWSYLPGQTGRFCRAGQRLPGSIGAVAEVAGRYLPMLSKIDA